MPKSKVLEDFLDEVSEKQFGIKRSIAIGTGICTTCGQEANMFKDVLSVKEYRISGMCQVCQDKVFG